MVAGSASGVGGLIVLAFGEVEDRILGTLMGFAGGVMLVVSFMKLFAEALTHLSQLEATISFAVGALVIISPVGKIAHTLRPSVTGVGAA